MDSITRVAVESDRFVHAYAEMWHTSACLLEVGQSQKEGCAHQFRASLVFTAFALEACLNHLGEKVFDCWPDLERLRPRGKLNVLCEHLGVAVDYSRRPWQIVKPLFGFRNDIAHARSEVISGTTVVAASDADTFDFVRTEWEAFATELNAVRAREDVEAIVGLLFAAGDFHDEVPFSFGMQIESHRAIDAGPS